MDNTTPEQLICGKTENEWIQISHEFETEIFRLCKENSLSYTQLNYVLGWIIAWTAEFVFGKPEPEKPNDHLQTS